MSSPQPMPSARRRPIPGMVSEPVAPPPPNPTEADQRVTGAEAAATSVSPPLIPDEPAGRVDARSSRGLRGDRRSAPSEPPPPSRRSGGLPPITRAPGWSTSASRWTCTTGSAAWSARPRPAIPGCGDRA
jgi:hypothetical protein